MTEFADELERTALEDLSRVPEVVATLNCDCVPAPSVSCCHTQIHILRFGIARFLAIYQRRFCDDEPALASSITELMGAAFRFDLNFQLNDAISIRGVGDLTSELVEISEEIRRIAVAHSNNNVLLACLAWLLPAAKRRRFFAEELSNLGDCAHWRQRLVWLTGLAVGMPRLAWTTHRDNRRGRA